MGSHLTDCKKQVGSWKEQAATHGLPDSLKPEHTHAAVSLPTFEPLAKCVTLRSMEVGVEPGKILDRMQGQGGEVGRKRAKAEWAQATKDVDPLKAKLQTMIPAARKERMPWLRRVISSDRGVTLAPSAAAMDIDEARLCQIWMYSLATRLDDCKRPASALAIGVGMSDPNQPLLRYNSRRWDPSSATWQEMEACVHIQAKKAGAEVDPVWRAGGAGTVSQ